MTYNEFQKACRKAWQTEGQGDITVQAAHAALLATEKNPYATKKQLISSAWQTYKKHRRITVGQEATHKETSFRR